jgi:drug/metabolite transporter (DMT)-like permease
MNADHARFSTSRLVNLTATAAAARRTPFELLLLAAIWGASFLFMRVAAAAFGAFALVEIRLCLGALVLLPFTVGTLRRMPREVWLRLAGVAFVNTAAPFLLFAWAAQRAPAGVVAITNATTVMFTALFARLMYGERIAARRIAGLVCGFVGVATLASGNGGGQSILAAVLAGTSGSILYGLGANLSARQLVPRLAPSAIAAGTLSVSAVLLAPVAALRWPAAPIAPVAWLSAAGLGLLCTGTAYLLYYRIMHKIGAAGVSTVTYLIPLFGVLWAWVLLGERLTATTAFSGALILGGVFLSQRR